MRKCLFIFLAFWAVACPCPQEGEGPSDPMCDTKAETWRVSELHFTASRSYDDGGGDRVRLDVQFSHRKTGRTLTVPAFWDGGDSFVVRFAPPEAGRWTWKSTCPEDPALHGRKGTLRCREYTGPLAIYRHGFIQARKGTKYLMYADGTPFFYLGDTHWGMYSEDLSDEHFKKIVRRRVEQGFTVLQSEPIGAPFHLLDGHVDADDIPGFRKADAYYQFIADAGLVHANAEFFFATSLTRELASDDEALKALCRYWVARFGAYPVLWTLAQEIDNDSYAELGGRFFDYTDNPWVKIAEYLHAADPYSHPLSGHQENAVNTSVTGAGTEPEESHADGNGVSAFLSEAVSERTGHSWWAAQWSPPLHETPGPEAVRDYWLSSRPAVNYEGRYCGVWTLNFGARAQGWISFLSGFCGYGYGAADIWLYHGGFQMDITSFDGVEHVTPQLKAIPWQEALEYPSARQMIHLKNLLESFDWWNLTPVIPGDPVFRDASGAAVYARTERMHLLYFYGKGTQTGRISGPVPDAGMQAQWYDPRTGEYRVAANPVREADGYWALPPKPDGQDWVLVIRTSETASRPFPLPVDESRSMLSRWAQKEVLESLLLDDMELDGRWKVREGKPELSYTRENSKDGTRALRHRMSLVDRDCLAVSRTPWGTFQGMQGGWTSVALEFDRPQDWSAYNRISLWAYIHPSRNPNVSFALSLVTETPDSILTHGRETNVDIPQGKWVQVLWEIDALPRDKVLRLEFCQTCTGYDPALGEEYVTIDLDRLELQKVVPDHYEGWDLPSGQFAFAHTGYLPEGRKVALAGPGEARRFVLLDGSGKVAHKGTAKPVSWKGNSFMELDFSAFRKPGTYRIRYGDSLSNPFPIGEAIWEEPLWNVLNFYYCQRCGYPVEGIHDVCHADVRSFWKDRTRVVNGGWHDAGDLSQGFWRTAYACYALLGALDVTSPALRERMEEEARWGLHWLLKVRFPEGRHPTWTLLRYYSDNEEGTLDDVAYPAQFVPWEVFQGVAVFLKALETLPLSEAEKESFSEAVKADWKAASESSDWGQASYLEAAWGAVASASAYKRFGNPLYREAALHFGDLLLRCQEQDSVDGMPVKGYFYSSSRREQLLQSSHTAFWEASMLAFSTLSEVFPERSAPWKEAARLYMDSYLKPGSELSAPYGLLSAGLYTREQTLGQPGTPVSRHYVMRTFPVWESHVFHGATNIQLSQAWALALAATLLEDREAMDLVQTQLEWTLGRNPFSSSLMYGAGYNYAPLFVYTTRHVAGAIPVGIDSFHDDEPFWNGTAHATSHEIWIEPVSRFLGTLSLYLKSRDL